MRLIRGLRKHFSALPVALAVMVLVGCGPQKGATTGGAANNTAGPSEAGSSMQVGLVLDTGGVDDRSFNASAWSGLQRAQKELGVKGKYVESHDASDYKTNLTSLANDGYALVFAVGYAMKGTLSEVAPQYPNVKFAIIDDTAPDSANCEGLKFKEQEGSFLAGYLAASVSKTKKIGFVGGQQIPLIEKFQAGYMAGAKMADPNVGVIATYTGDWEDENKARSQADQQFGQGADIIYQAAGKGGLGVIEAARARGPGSYAIGVDQDQDYIAPGRVLTSMVKHVDNAVYDTIQRLKTGQFDQGTHVYGLKEAGVGLSEMKYTKQDVPPAVLTNLDKIKQMIIDGKIVPPTSVQEVKVFQPPGI